MKEGFVPSGDVAGQTVALRKLMADAERLATYQQAGDVLRELGEEE